MPYVKRGRSVFKTSGKKVGTSKTLAKARRYARTLRAIEHGWTPKKKK